MAKKQNSLNNLFVNQPFSSPGPVVSSTYTATLEDNLIEVNYGGAVTIYLPAPSTSGATANKGKVYTIKDISGAALTNNISVVPLGGTIDGASGYVINANYGFAQVYCNGSNWFVQSALQSSSSSPTVVRQYIGGSGYSTTLTGTWANTGLSITVPPGFGTFRLKYHVVGSVYNNGNGSLISQAKIVDPFGADVPNSASNFASIGYVLGSTELMGGTANFDIKLSVTGTYTIWIIKFVGGGSPNTGQGLNMDSQSYIEYMSE